MKIPEYLVNALSKKTIKKSGGFKHSNNKELVVYLPIIFK